MMNSSHEKTKKILKIVGFILLGVGVVFALIGFIDFFTADGMPENFWCLFVGFPCLGFGGMLTIFSHHREISRYVKNEAVPVANEAAEELKPAVKSVVSAAKEAIKDESLLCPNCGEKNDIDSRFCKNCGTAFSVVCPSCGNSTDAGKFCNHCGKEL